MVRQPCREKSGYCAEFRAAEVFGKGDDYGTGKGILYLI